MTMLRLAETEMRPAAVALDAWFPSRPAPAVSEQRAALEAERVEIAASINRLVALMDDDDLDPEALEALTEEVASLFGRAEELRLARALTDRAALDTWLVEVDFD
jgi:hypothetical protein